MKYVLSLVLIVAVMFMTSSALAQEVRHHGFQFRYAGGVGYLIDNESSLGAKDDVIEGLTVENSLYFGGFVVPGFAVGGVVEDHYLHSPQLSVEGRSMVVDPSFHVNLASVGPYLDFYPDPKEGGLHLMINGGVAVLRLTNNVVDVSSNGMNVGGGVGYDWRVRTSDWNVGVLAKLSYSNVDFVVGRNTSNESILVKSLMFSVSYH